GVPSRVDGHPCWCWRTCLAALIRLPRMLPLARTPPGVRGAVRPGLLSLRTVSAD
ncbi:hypothetical protein PIB30_116509, partial [Stylosanthes scabra]|nr:hypothetical protein [Stylosanthes scabra]